MDSAPTLIERLTYFRTCSPLQVIDISDQIFPSEVVPTAYLDGLDEPDRILCLRACLISWAISSGEKIPREMQLRTVLACWKKSDTLVSARTGSGKTLPMALAILLDDPAMNYKTITISPLKRLQSTQENNFNTCCGIETVVINEDTPRDEKWWNVCFQLLFTSISSQFFDPPYMSIGECL
jgi:hypothetical protein